MATRSSLSTENSFSRYKQLKQRISKFLGKQASGIRASMKTALSHPLQKLVDEFQHIGLIKVTSGDAEIFIPRDLLSKTSGLLYDLVNDLGTNFDYGVPIPISDKFSNVLADYAGYLAANLDAKSFDMAIDSPNIQFVRKQDRILGGYVSDASSFVTKTYSASELYTQFDLATYLDDFDYFRAVMEKVYYDWKDLWPDIANGPIPEVNYDIYTFTPWPYLPFDFFTDPIFCRLWLERNAPEGSTPKDVILNGNVKYSTRQRVDHTFNKIRVWIDVSYHSYATDTHSYYITVTFDSDSARVKREDIFSSYSLPRVVIAMLNPTPIDRLSQLINDGVSNLTRDILFKMSIYWNEDGRADKLEYYTARDVRMLDTTSEYPWSRVKPDPNSEGNHDVFTMQL